MEYTADSAWSSRSAKPAPKRRNASREMSIEVAKAERLIQVKLSGMPRQEFIVMMLGELNALVAKDPSLSVLIDETGLDPRFVRPGDMQKFAAAWVGGSALKATRLAVFVANDATFGLNRMFEGMAETHGRVRVFRDRAAALTWLREEPLG